MGPDHAIYAIILKPHYKPRGSFSIDPYHDQVSVSTSSSFRGALFSLKNCGVSLDPHPEHDGNDKNLHPHVFRGNRERAHVDTFMRLPLLTQTVTKTMSPYFLKISLYLSGSVIPALLGGFLTHTAHRR